MFLAMCDVCLCHCWGPFSSVSPARLACHLSPWSHIVLRQPLQSGQKKGKGGSFNQYFRNQKPPTPSWFCAEQTTIVLLVSQ